MQVTATPGVGVPTPATPYVTTTVKQEPPLTTRVIPSMSSPTIEHPTTDVMPEKTETEMVRDELHFKAQDHQLQIHLL